MKKERIGKIIIVIIGLLLIVSSLGKFFAPVQTIDAFTKWRLLDYLIFIGITELLIGVFLLISRTSKLGFYLACAYFGGAIVTHLSVHEINYMLIPIVILFILSIGFLLRSPELFR
ncbi:MAG: DoxX family protein [Nanoarchaeota archaeon]